MIRSFTFAVAVGFGQGQISLSPIGVLLAIESRVNRTVTTETIDLGRKTLSRVREVGSVLYLNKQNASCEVLSELKQIRSLQVKN